MGTLSGCLFVSVVFIATFTIVAEAMASSASASSIGIQIAILIAATIFIGVRIKRRATRKAVKCPKCKQVNTVHDRQCDNCGHVGYKAGHLEGKKVISWVCPACKAPLVTLSCVSCGTDLEYLFHS